MKPSSSEGNNAGGPIEGASTGRCWIDAASAAGGNLSASATAAESSGTHLADSPASGSTVAITTTTTPAAIHLPMENR